MNRKVVVIVNPGQKGSDNYCPNVYTDLGNYKDFLSSPIGGLWDLQSEFQQHDKPSKDTISKMIAGLKSYDYAMVIYCGHGGTRSRDNKFILQINDKEEVYADDLRFGASKQTVIIDACREVYKELLTESRKYASFASADKNINPEHCKLYYNQRISECSQSLVLMYSCSYDQRAGENSSGGFYSQSLIDEAKNWSTRQNVDLSQNYRIFSVVAAHDSTITPVYNLSGGRQVPDIEKPRSEKHFPFCILA